MLYGNYNIMNMLGMSNLAIFSNPFNAYGSNYMTGSIYGTNGCCSTNDSTYKTALGWNLGYMLAGVAGTAISTSVRNYQSSEDKLAELEAEKEDILSKAGESEDGILNFDIGSSSENTALNEAKNAYKEAESAHNNAKGTTADKQTAYNAAKADFTPAMETLINTYSSLPEETKKEKASEYQRAMEKKTAYERAEKELTEAKNAEAEAKTKLDTAKTNQKKAQEAYDAKQESMKTAQADLKDVNNRIKEVKLDDADGNRLGRVSKNKLDEMIDSEDYSKVNERHLKSALYAYRNATNDDDKAKYKNAFKEMYNQYVANGNEPGTDLKEAYNLLK